MEPHPTELLPLRLHLDELCLREVDDAAAGVLAGLVVAGLVPERHRHFLPNLHRNVPREPQPALAGMLAYHRHARTQVTPERWDLPFAVVENGRVIGNQTLHAVDFARTRVLGTGSYLAPDRQRRGIGRRIRAMALEFAFTRLGARAVTSGYAVGNIGSARVSAALGYRRVAVRTEVHEGLAHPVVDLRLDAERWPEFRPGRLDRLVVEWPEQAWRERLGLQ